MTRTTDTSIELGPIDGPTHLVLAFVDEGARETYSTEQLLLASIRSAELQAQTLVHGGYTGFEGLSDYFAGLAADWRGWDGARDWSSAEGHLSIATTMDRTGHVRIRSTIRPDPGRDDWIAIATVQLEAGSLNVVHAVVRDFIRSLV